MIAINDSDFSKEVLSSSLPVLVDFWATWCGPCKAMMPHMETLSKEYGDKLKVVKIEADKNPSISNSYGVTGIPTIILFKDGKMVAKHVGAAPLAGLKKFVDPHL